MTKKSKRFKKTTKGSKRSKVASKPVKATRANTKTAPAATPVTRSNSARAHITEGTRLYALAGRPTKADFIKVYGPKGPKMTWAQRRRAKAGVDAKHFQEALKAKLSSDALCLTVLCEVCELKTSVFRPPKLRLLSTFIWWLFGAPFAWGF